MPQTVWSGSIAWGLVSIPVAVQSAIGSEHTVSFHQMHRDDYGRVRYRKVCELDGQELGTGDIVRGYETADGRTVAVTDEELDALPLPTEHALEMHGYVDVRDIDPRRLSRPYFLRPGRAAAKPYVLLRQALARADRAGVVKMALRGREVLALIRVHGEILVLHQLYWPDELRSPDGIAPPQSVTVTDDEIAAATALMDAIGPADLDAMHDDYAAAVRAVVDAKLAGAPLPEGGPEIPAAPTVDLMEALRASLEAAGKSPKATGARKSTARQPQHAKSRR